MANDPLNDIRSIRREISRECGDQTDKVFEFYQNVQERMQRAGHFQFVNTRQESDRNHHEPERPEATATNR